MPNKTLDDSRPIRPRLHLNVWLSLSLVVIFAIYVVRFATQVQIGVSHDDAEYVVLAQSFATGQPYRLVNHPAAPLETTWPPGYPLFVLTLPWLLFGPNYDLLRGLNVVLAFYCGLVGYRLLRGSVSPPVAAAVVALFILNPQVIKWATILMSDIPFTLFSLVFWLVFIHWQTHHRAARRWLVFSAVWLAIAILTRYWGVAFLAAAVLYLLVERRFRQSVAFTGVTLLLIAPFVIFLATQGVNTPNSFFAWESLTRDVGTHLTNIAISLQTYGQTIPLVLVPLLGPQVVERLSTIGLAWIVAVVHALILLVVAIGFWHGLKSVRLLALSTGCYLVAVIILTEHNNQSTLIFDEPRYLVPILLFLYLFMILGIGRLAALRLSQTQVTRIIQVSMLSLGIILTARNIQQATIPFSVPNLASGTDWIKANTQADAVFMTIDPVDRYLYIQRRTLSFPRDAGTFWLALQRYEVDYLLIARPLREDNDSWYANVDQKPDPNIERVIRPAMLQHPDCFASVYHDTSTGTEIYEVRNDCTVLQAPLPDGGQGSF